MDDMQISGIEPLSLAKQQLIKDWDAISFIQKHIEAKRDDITKGT